MSEKIEPALTAEEWAHGLHSDDLSASLRGSMGTVGPRLYVEVRAQPLGGILGNERDIHALAALCLYGQPFGFTREMVTELRYVGRAAEDDGADGSMAFRVADLIEALLPPE